MTMNEWHAKLDELWDDFWPATELRPLAVIDFINSVFFARQFDEIQVKEFKSQDRIVNPLAQPVFSVNHDDLRWSSFQHLDEHRLYLLFNKKDGVLDLVKNTEAYRKLRKFDEVESEDLKPTPQLLAKTVRMVKDIEAANDDTRNLMNEYLLSKAEEARKTREFELSSSPNSNVKKTEQPKRLSNVYVLLLLLFLIAFGGTFFYFQNRKPNAALKSQGTPRDSATQSDTSLVLASKKNLDKKNVVGKKNSKSGVKKGVKAQEKKPVAKNGQEKTINANTGIEDESRAKAETKGLYKIISKAYFHNEPDEATRRNAFVVHWNNSYSKLKALDEKNGFIYVVFHNHLNQ